MLIRKRKHRQIKWLPLKQQHIAIRAQRFDCAGIVAGVPAAPRQQRAEPGRRCRRCWLGRHTAARGAPPSSAIRWLSSPYRRSCGQFGWSPAPWCCVPGSLGHQGGSESEPGSCLADWAPELLLHCLLLRCHN